ncbi:MAG: glycosyltransferase [Candidatus Acidiferrales bacterium]
MKVSVAMITYNHERFIAQALESVLAQQVNFDYEIVVGEDCSTDRTREILMDFHRRYPDKIVPLLRERNLGTMPNFEATLAKCQGKYLAILEGDDCWKFPDKLQRQVDFLDAHPDFAMCCSRAEVVDEGGADAAWIWPSRAAGAYGLEDLLAENFIATCSVLYRWGSLGSLPPWFHKMKLGDWPLHALVARTGKIELMDDVMAVYRMHAGGIWSSLSERTRLRATVQMMRELDRQLEFRYTRIIRKTIAGFYSGMAMIARQEGRRVETAKHLASCVWNGGLKERGNRRTLASFAGYALMGSWYKVFSKTKRA